MPFGTSGCAHWCAFSGGRRLHCLSQATGEKYFRGGGVATMLSKCADGGVQLGSGAGNGQRGICRSNGPTLSPCRLLAIKRRRLRVNHRRYQPTAGGYRPMACNSWPNLVGQAGPENRPVNASARRQCVYSPPKGLASGLLIFHVTWRAVECFGGVPKAAVGGVEGRCSACCTGART